MEETKNKVGRPSDYTQEMALLICEDIATGKSIRAVCRDENRPAISTVFRWVRDYPEFRKQYEDASSDRVDYQLEELNDLGQEAIDYAMSETENKNVSAVITAYKLKADNMRWTMSKIKPKKYGDKQDITSGGEPIMFLPTEIINKIKDEPTS